MIFSNLSTVAFIFAMLIVFQLKHFAGDYLLQTQWMVHGKSKKGADFIPPMLSHVSVHAGMTLLILLLVSPRLWYLAGLDFAIHFVLDRIKSGPSLLGRFSDMSKRSFWIPLGFDQMAHHLTHYFMIWVLVAHR